MLIGGGSIFWIYNSLEDPDGFLMTREFDVVVDSYAVVFKGLETDLDSPSDFWIERTDETISVKIRGASNNPSDEIFLGMAGVSDASNYLNKVKYHVVEDFSWSFDPSIDTSPDITYTVHGGGSPQGPPVIHSFWTEHATGQGTQILEWETSLTSFLANIKDIWIVVMNGDGSSDINLKIQIGAKIPILKTVGNLLLAGGFVTLILGSLIIIFGVIRLRT
jgi:hypothetical protein